MLLFSATWTLASADCTFRATPERLHAALEAAEGAYVSLDVPEFERAMTEVDFVVPCLEGPVSPADAAWLHRMRGVGRYVAGDLQATRASLVAARRLEPDYTFSEGVLPKGFELRDLYEGLPAEVGPTARIRRPSRRAVPWFDGVVSRERPTDAPVLWQLQEGDRVADTRYLEAGEEMPWYPGANRDQVPWAIGGAVAAAGAGAAFGLAARSHGLVTDPDPAAELLSESELRRVRVNTNTLAVVGTGLVVVAATEWVVALWKGSRE